MHAHRSVVIVTLLMMSTTLIASSGSTMEKRTFFSDLDATIQVSGTKITPRISADRYFRLMARINIYGLYCDPGNKLGYSTRASVLQKSAVRLEKLAARVFGGEIAAYNRFERYRNEESLRFIRSDRQEVCTGSFDAFIAFTAMNTKELEAHLAQTPFKSL